MSDPVPTGFARFARAPLLTVTLVVAIIVILGGNHPPFGTSARYIVSSREMVAGGDWVVPHLGHVAYFEKPVLTYWLGALSRMAFGDSWIATQLPAGLSMLVVLLVTCAIGTRWRGRPFGLGAALLLASCGAVVVETTTLTTDPILSACLAVAWWSFLRWEEARATRWRLLFWCALGLGMLDKGPIALILPGLALGGYALLDGGVKGVLRLARELGLLSGAAIVLAINLPWTLLVWQRDPRLLWFFYVRCNFRGFFDKAVHHPGSWYYYGPALLLTLAPASLLLLPATAAGCVRAVRGRRDPDRTRLFLASVVLFPMLFLSASTSKLVAYPMPLLLAIVLLGYDVLVGWDARRSRAASVALAACAALLLVAIAGACGVLAWDVAGLPAALAAQVAEFKARIVPDPRLFVAAAIFGVALIGTFVLAMRRRLLAGMAALGAGTLLFVCVVMPGATAIAPELDPRPALAVLATERRPDEPIYLHERVVQEYLVHYEVGERMRIVDRCRELGLGHFVEVRGPEVPLPDIPDDARPELLPDHPWLASRDALATAWLGPKRIWLIGDHKIVDDLRARGLAVHEQGRSGVVLLLSNRP